MSRASQTELPSTEPRPASIELRGEKLDLYADHAAFWPAESTLLLADTHWGKAASLRAGTIPVPDTEVDYDLNRLSRLIEVTNANRLVVLGDLLHHRSGREPQTIEAIARWRERHDAVEMLIVEGNHDRSAGPLPAEWSMVSVGELLHVGPFVLQHFPEPSEDGYVLCGHLHPKVRLTGAAGQGLRLPCFWFGPDVGFFRHLGLFAAVQQFIRKKRTPSM